MPDLIVKGMDMPECCAACPFKEPYTTVQVPGMRGYYRLISKCCMAPESIEDPYRTSDWMLDHRENWCPLGVSEPDPAKQEQDKRLSDLNAPMITRDRYAEICIAENKGRLAVLPCKVGETIWYISQGKIFESLCNYVSIHRDGVYVTLYDYDGDNASYAAKDVFTSLPAAAQALQERQEKRKRTSEASHE